MRCSSRVVPRVTDTRACVWPRVNSAEPWVRGSTPTSQLIARTVSRSRPSTRSPRVSTCSRMVRYSMSSMTLATSLVFSGNSAASCSWIVALSAASAWVRSAFSGRFSASVTRGSASALTRATSSAGGSILVHSILGWRISATSSLAASKSSRMPLCATSRPFTISASVSSSAPPSTITIESAEPDTTMSTSENSSCWHLGHGERRRGRRHAQHVGVVLLVRRQHVDEDLDLVLEAFGEERADGAVGDPRRQNLLVLWPPFTLQKAARDLAGGIALFTVFDGEGEEREGRDVVPHRHRRQQHRLPELHQAGAGGLLGQPSRLELQGAAGEIAFDVFHHIACLEHKEMREAHRCSSGAPNATPAVLMAETQLVDELPIPLQVVALQVLEQAPALRHHAQQAALPVKVLGVHPEVVGEAVDPLGEQRDLDRGRPRVPLVPPVLPDRRRLVIHLFQFPNY